MARALERGVMIARDLQAAAAREFDIAIIGGGIYGVSLLRQAALRGLSACLCEAGDFGGGTSWNTLRILHGGLRYLQTLNLGRFRQSTRARRGMARQFPHLVRPLRCLMPLYGQGLKKPSVLRLGLSVSDFLDRHRNTGLPRRVHLPDGGMLDASATRLAFPMVRTEGLRGAACWSDYFMLSSERVLIEQLHEACGHGAMALNYTEAVDIATHGNAVRGLQLCDRLSGDAYTLKAKQVVNCAGPRLRDFARGRGGDAERLFRPSLAFNLLLDLSLPGDAAYAVAAPEAGSPVLFLLPRPGTVLAGTLHLTREDDTVDAQPTSAEIQYFLDLLNAAVPGLGAAPERVRRVFAGLLPAGRAGSAELACREVLFDHGALGGIQGLYSVSGVKFTTAGEVSRRTLALMGHGARREPARSSPPLQGADFMLDARELWSQDAAALGAMLHRTVETESVQCLDDLILRRCNWAVTEADLVPVSARVKSLVNLPETAAYAQRSAMPAE
jgi:glycerol-3-phosphate dehydrogenase